MYGTYTGGVLKTIKPPVRFTLHLVLSLGVSLIISVLPENVTKKHPLQIIY